MRMVRSIVGPFLLFFVGAVAVAIIPPRSPAPAHATAAPESRDNLAAALLSPPDAPQEVAPTLAAPAVANAPQAASQEDPAALAEQAAEAGIAHNWYALAAALLGLVAWALRRYATPASFFHTNVGGAVLTGILSFISIWIPVVASGHITIASAVAAVTTAITSTLALSNPSTAAGATVGPTVKS